MYYAIKSGQGDYTFWYNIAHGWLLQGFKREDGVRATIFHERPDNLVEVFNAFSPEDTCIIVEISA